MNPFGWLKLGEKAYDAFQRHRKYRQRRKKEKKERRLAREIRKDIESLQEGTMDVKQFAIQTILGLLRHAMTASPFLSALVSEDQLVQIATVIAGLGGFVWSAYRKWKAAQ